APPAIAPVSLHDALPIFLRGGGGVVGALERGAVGEDAVTRDRAGDVAAVRGAVERVQVGRRDTLRIRAVVVVADEVDAALDLGRDRKSTRLHSSHRTTS